MKFKEIFDHSNIEIDDCYELKRVAHSTNGNLGLLKNNGLFNEYEKGTYEVMIISDEGGEEWGYFGLTENKAISIFESHLEND